MFKQQDEAGLSNDLEGDRKRKYSGGRGGGGDPPGPLKDVKMKFLRTFKTIKEEKLALDELEDTSISTQATEMDWTNLVETPQEINLSRVYEFYHSIKSKTFREEGVHRP